MVGVGDGVGDGVGVVVGLHGSDGVPFATFVQPISLSVGSSLV